MKNKFMYKVFKVIAICFLSIVVIDNISAQDSSDEYFTLARAEGLKGNFAKAADYCEKGLKKSPLDMDIKEYLGKCYMELGQLEKARTTLLEVLVKSPRRVDARHYLINIETQTKRYYSAVCYANELLEITPYSKALWMKKVQLYNLMENRVEANRTAKRLHHIFPEDEEVKTLYNNILREEAVKLSKGKDFISAIDQYEKILEVSTTDPEAYISLINAYTQTGNYSAALSVADRGLQAIPYHSGILDKKIGLLDETHEYQKAISVTEDRLKRGDSPHYRSILNYLVSKAARFYKNADPYVLYGRIYEQNPNDREAFEYLLNTSISRGYYAQAEELIKQGLKTNPNDKDLLAKQLHIYEMQKNWEKSGFVVDKLYALYPQDTDIRDKYYAWTYQKAKTDYSEQNYKEALWGFLKISQTEEYSKYAAQYIFAIQAVQKSYSEALGTIDGLIQKYPSESQYVLNKIDLLISMEDFSNAYELAKTSYENHPDKPEYKHMVNTASISYIKALNKNEDYARVKAITDELLAADPLNVEAYNYGINARVAMKQYEEAIAFIKSRPDDVVPAKNTQLKLAGVYSEAKQHDQSAAILKELHTAYPYNDSLKNNLVEEMLLHAKSLDDSGSYEQSLKVYEEIREIEPKNITAAIKQTNILIENNELEYSMEIIDSSLVYNNEHPDLLYQKGLIYEKMGNYKLAKEYHAKFVSPLDKERQHKERLEYLEGKGLKNQVNLSYLRATSDSTYLINTSVATLEYQREINKNNTIVARANYAARKAGVGLQGEVDWYHTFSNKSSILASAGIANQFFPKYKASLSFYQPFAKNWQVEIGGRYARLQNDSNLVTGVLGIERTFDRVWLNAKGLLMKDDDNKFYQTILAQARFYMKNERDYVVAMASAGTAPEDQRLDFQVNTFTSFVNTMVGAGYFHHINARTSFGVQGNWYNFKISPQAHLNQYNVFLTLRTKF